MLRWAFFPEKRAVRCPMCGAPTRLLVAFNEKAGPACRPVENARCAHRQGRVDVNEVLDVRPTDLQLFCYEASMGATAGGLGGRPVGFRQSTGGRPQGPAWHTRCKPSGAGGGRLTLICASQRRSPCKCHLREPCGHGLPRFSQPGRSGEARCALIWYQSPSFALLFVLDIEISQLE